MSDDSPRYEVGYGKPPQGTRFKKGKSGNPTGRPKGSKNLATIFAELGNERVTVTENGRTRRLTKMEAIILQLTNKSLSGNLVAIRDHLRMSQLLEGSGRAELSSTPVSEADREVMKSIVERIHKVEQAEPEEVQIPASDSASPSKRDEAC